MRPYLPLVAALLGGQFVPSKSKRAVGQTQQTIHHARATDLAQIIKKNGLEFGRMSIGVDDRMVELFSDNGGACFIRGSHMPSPSNDSLRACRQEAPLFRTSVG